MQNTNSFSVGKIRINQMDTPLGLDLPSPSFSWQLSASEPDILQKKARISVTAQPSSRLVWDSGVMETGNAAGFSYAGEPLLPETRYNVKVQVWLEDGRMQEGETWFETGLMDPSMKAWEGAVFIGSPDLPVSSGRIGVFHLETTLTIEKGSQAGVIFGADDPRLADRRKNELQVEGHSEIRYVLNVETWPATLQIFRIGYSPEDSETEPLYVIPVTDPATGEPLITEDTLRQPHHLNIEVAGNGAYTWFDGIRIDSVLQESPMGKRTVPRQLNPLGLVDVTTYPRLYRIGYYCGPDTRARFDGLRVSHLRKPHRLIAAFDTEEGRVLTGEQKVLLDPDRPGLPMLRRSFTVNGAVRKARLYATARGIYECSINGQRTGNEYFAPGASQFDHHLIYQTMDITPYLRQGENGIGCILASGWWSDSFSFRMGNYNYWGDENSFLAKLVIWYEDGRREVFGTSEEDWVCFHDGPYLYAGFFNGEEYDARREAVYREFSLPGYERKNGKKAQEKNPVPMEEKEGIFPGAAKWPAVNQTEPAITGSFCAPVCEGEVLCAQSMTEPLPGLYIYDLGQEIAGVVRIRLKAPAGTRITIRHGEMLYPRLPAYEGLWGQMLQANLRDADNTDIVIAGEEEFVYQPRFTFCGFRYIEITGIPAPLDVRDVCGVVLSSVKAITGEFTCSHPLVNRFVKNVGYSQLANFISIPTDCPQRNERMGWMGDTHVFCRTATYQSNVMNFYLRNLEAMRDLQLPNGRLPSIAPFGGGFGGMTYESAMPLMVWELYQQYGDASVIREYYVSMKRWMASMKAEGLPGITQHPPLSWLGDWLAPDPADEQLVFNAFHYRNAVLMEKFARILGKDADAEAYREEAQATKQFWNQRFVEPETGRTLCADGTECDVQGSYSIGLSCGVFDEAVRDKAFAHLNRTTEEGNYTIRTGFFGTGPLNPMLSEGGYPETAQKTMTQTACPSWLYPVTQGATSIWERWDSFTEENGFGENNSMNSFNHYSLGSVLSWLYENVLGIRRDEEHPGYKHFSLKPETGTFTFAKGGIDTPYGRIESGWEVCENGSVRYRCRIPANTTAELMWKGTTKTLGSGEHEMILA